MWERGEIKLSIVLASVFAAAFLASAYLNYAQHEASQQEQTQLQGQITDLTYQLKQNQTGSSATGSPSPSPSPSATPTPSPTSTATQATNNATIKVSQFGVHFTVSDPIGDLTYAPEQSGSYEIAAFTTQSLLAKYPDCQPGVLGSLVRKPKGAAASSADDFIKTIGNYNYYYLTAYGYCTSDQSGRDTIAADRAAIQDSALPSLAQ